MTNDTPDTPNQVNGTTLPESRQAAVHQAAVYYQEVAHERDKLTALVTKLQGDLAGLKVVLEAKEAQLNDAKSHAESALLIRDQAMGERAKWEGLFCSILAQLNAFKVPAQPLVMDIEPRGPSGHS